MRNTLTFDKDCAIVIPLVEIYSLLRSRHSSKRVVMYSVCISLHIEILVSTYCLIFNYWLLANNIRSACWKFSLKFFETNFWYLVRSFKSYTEDSGLSKLPQPVNALVKRKIHYQWFATSKIVLQRAILEVIGTQWRKGLCVWITWWMILLTILKSWSFIFGTCKLSHKRRGVWSNLSVGHPFAAFFSSRFSHTACYRTHNKLAFWNVTLT